MPTRAAVSDKEWPRLPSRSTLVDGGDTVELLQCALEFIADRSQPKPERRRVATAVIHVRPDLWQVVHPIWIETLFGDDAV